MSKEIISDGNDFVIEHVNRAFGGARREVLAVSGDDGSVTIGDLAIDKDGVVTIAGTEVLSGTVADNLSIASGNDIVAAGGASNLDYSLSSGFWKGPTGLTTWAGKQAATAAANLIADPGNAGAVPVTASGCCALTSAGAETRTLAAPAFIGQRISLIHDVDGGAVVLTVASAVNQTGNNTLTFTEVQDMCVLECMQVAGSRVWRIVANDGVALSTV